MSHTSHSFDMKEPASVFAQSRGERATGIVRSFYLRAVLRGPPRSMKTYKTVDGVGVMFPKASWAWRRYSAPKPRGMGAQPIVLVLSDTESETRKRLMKSGSEEQRCSRSRIGVASALICLRQLFVGGA